MTPEQPVQPEPTLRFKEDDKVRVIKGTYTGKTGEVYIVDENDVDKPYFVALDERTVWLPDSDLAPYAEPETQQTKDNMEEKELNLATLLKGCEGEKFYSPNYGEIELIETSTLGNRPLKWQRKENFFHTFSDGRIYSDSEPTIFPSRALYLKHPLEAAKAWSEWAEERKPKIWRAKPGEVYYWITGSLIVESSYESRSQGDDELYQAGDYFRTESEAKEAASQIRELLTKFHEQHQKV